MKTETKFTCIIGLGDDHDQITKAAIRSMIATSKQVPILIGSVSHPGKTDLSQMVRLFPTIQDGKMIEASITLESGIDINKLLVGDKLNHSVGMKLIKEDEL